MPLMQQALGYLLDRGDERLNARVGQTLRYVAPADWVWRDVTIAQPGGDEASGVVRRVVLFEGAPLLEFDETDRAGAYRAVVAGEGKEKLEFAVQSDPGESRIEELSEARLRCWRSAARWRRRSVRRDSAGEMIDLLLKLFGVQIDEAVQVTSASLRLRNGDAIGWVLLLFLALARLAWLVYSRGAHRGLSRWRRRVLIGLRTLVFFLILLIFLRPVVSFSVEGKIRALLVGLFDESSSMRIPDPRVDATDLRRAAIAAGAARSGGGTGAIAE